MTNDEMIYRAALNKWGVAAQVQMVMEEAGELIAALNQFYFRDRIDRAAMADEVADMEIMLGQLRLMVGDDEVNVAKTAKLERLAERLWGEGVCKTWMTRHKNEQYNRTGV